MSLNDDGLLSADIAKLINVFRSESALWFGLAERLNRLGQRLALRELEFQTEGGLADSRVLVLLLFFRSLTNFQGTVLMAERGMIIEARTLSRNCIECAICMAGLKVDPEQWKALLRDEIGSRKSRAKYLLRNEDWLASGDVEQLRTLVKTLEEQWNASSRLDYAKIAEKAGIEILYLLYRQLSADAAHPSVEALSRYIAEDEDGAIKTLQSLPAIKSGDISGTLSILCNCFFLVCSVLIEYFPDQAHQHELGECWEEFKRLTKTMKIETSK